LGNKETIIKEVGERTRKGSHARIQGKITRGIWKGKKGHGSVMHRKFECGKT
jgi:hypothetical protein